MNKLSADTAKLISALQVITGVENVVKELVENSLDAGATCIEVRFENFGLSKIEIRDNGSGIKQSDVEYAAQVHYTSKISCKEDLEALHTYGFRGEALSSLCEVAEVFITTRTKEDAFSTKYSLNHNGQVIATRPCHLAQGTTVTVLSLFSKMPVRRQLYQSTNKRKQALKLSEDMMMSFGLIYPSVRFSFVHNGSVIWQKPKCGSLQSALENVLGSSFASQMVGVDHENKENQICLSAFIPVSNATKHFRRSNDRCFVYINKRPVLDKEIEKIIKSHTSKKAESSNQTLKWPAFFLSVELPSDRIDSNVESDKSKVMITEKETVLTALEQMLLEAYSSLSDSTGADKENTVQTQNCAMKENSSGKNSVVENVEHSTFGIISGELPVNDESRKKSNSYDSIGSAGHVSTPQNAISGSWSEGRCFADEEGSPLEPVRVLQCSDRFHESTPKARPKDITEPRGLHSAHDSTSFGNSKPDGSSMHTMNKDSQDRAFNGRKNKPPASREQTNSVQPAGNTLFSYLTTPERNYTTSDTFTRTHDESSEVQHAPALLETQNFSTVTSGKARAVPVNDTPGKNAPCHEKSMKMPLIAKSVSETGRQHNRHPPRPKQLHIRLQEQSQGPEMNFSTEFHRIRFNLSHKKKALSCMCNLEEGAFAVGTIGDLRAGVLLDTREKKLYLANLIRLQESRLFFSLMENHALRTKDLGIPISIPIASLSEDARKGLDCLTTCQSSSAPELEYSDDRIRKNGFRVYLGKDANQEEALQIREITNIVSYYGVDDLTGILSIVGVTPPPCTLYDTRPFKVIHYLRAEAVRMTYSLPVDTSALKNLKQVEQYFPKNVKDWRCFHEKAIFHPLYDINKLI